MKEVAYCKRCGRRLKDPISKERGYGKTCFEKSQKHTQQRLWTLENRRYENEDSQD